MPGDSSIRVSDTQVTQAAPRRQARPADPCAMVIFGASGDLTRRLLVPALYNLARTNLLPEKFSLIGVARSEETPESWAASLRDMLKTTLGGDIDEAVWKRLTAAMSYVAGDVSTPALYEKLRGALDEAASRHGTKGNVIFYLAVADRFFGPIIDQLGAAKLSEDSPGGEHWRRVVVEKPFGNSVASARALNKRILRTLREDQIFRIDHFLGKDAVQSIMAFRFANGLFEPIWSRDRIDHVQITVAETVGVEKRGDFYEATGALRDMVPNHVFALLSMVAMEPPVGFDEAAIRSKKADVFCAMPAIDPAWAVRGRYAAGTVLDKPVRAYRQEPGIAPDSNVET
jgi:glucose-6-phosphate 1-dehydrogenase